MHTFVPAIPFGGADQDREGQSICVRQPQTMLKAPGRQRLSDIDLIMLQRTNEDGIMAVGCQMRNG